MTKEEALETLAQSTWLALYEGNSQFENNTLEEALQQVGAIREAVLRDGYGLNPAYCRNTRDEQAQSEG